VIEAEPVTDLMDGLIAEVVRLARTAGQRRVEDDDAVVIRR